MFSFWASFDCCVEDLHVLQPRPGLLGQELPHPPVSGAVVEEEGGVAPQLAPLSAAAEVADQATAEEGCQFGKRSIEVFVSFLERWELLVLVKDRFEFSNGRLFFPTLTSLPGGIRSLLNMFLFGVGSIASRFYFSSGWDVSLFESNVSVVSFLTPRIFFEVKSVLSP